MKIFNQISQLQSYITKKKKQNLQIGFVPTMGALHNGHLSLIRKARRENDIIVVSIFVNPTQFGPHEDLTSYPRQKNKDILLTRKENVDIIFYPSVKTVYPNRYLTYINVESMTEKLCGRSRSGHFRGVTTIVGKLLNIVAPNRLYLGQKDAQQCAVVTQMVRDLNFPVTVRVCPTVREKDGLAMSSRNKYLNPKQRQEAPILYKALKLAKTKIRSGNKNKQQITQLIRRTIRQNSSGTIDYIECVDAETLQPLTRLSGRVLIALAVKFGRARLIDNIIVRV